MDCFVSNYFSILEQFLIITECEPDKKRWVLVKEYLLPLNIREKTDSYLLFDSNAELRDRLKCACAAAKTGIKEGVLTGIFFGGIWGILKDVNKYNGDLKKNMEKDGDETNVKITNDSFAVLKSFKYSKQFSSTTEPMSVFTSLSKTKLLKESVKSFNLNNNSDNISVAENNVKNSLEDINEKNSKSESLNSDVKKYNYKNSFIFNKNQEKVEIIGCALIQTGESLNSIKSESSSSDEVLKAINEDIDVSEINIQESKEESVQMTDVQKPSRTAGLAKRKKTIISMKDKKPMNLKFKDGLEKKKQPVDFREESDLSYNYKTALLSNLPEDVSPALEFEKLTQKESASSHKRQRIRMSKLGKANCENGTSENRMCEKPHREFKIEQRRRKLPYLINLEDIVDVKDMQEHSPPSPDPENQNKNNNMYRISGVSAFLKEIQELKESLLREVRPESIDDISSESSRRESISTEFFVPHQVNYENETVFHAVDKVDDDKFEGKKMPEDSLMRKESQKSQNKREETKLEKVQELSVVPAPRGRSTIHALTLQPQTEVIPAPRKKKLSDVLTPNSQLKKTPTPKRRTLSSHNSSNLESEEILEVKKKEFSNDVSSHNIEVPAVVPAPRKKKVSNVSTSHLQETEVPQNSTRNSYEYFPSVLEEPQVTPAPRHKKSTDTSTPQTETHKKSTGTITPRTETHKKSTGTITPRTETRKKSTGTITPQTETKVTPAPRKKSLAILGPHDLSIEDLPKQKRHKLEEISPFKKRQSPVMSISPTSSLEKNGQKVLNYTSSPAHCLTFLASANNNNNNNYNYMFTNAFSCALILGVICCGLSALKASFSVSNC